MKRTLLNLHSVVMAAAACLAVSGIVAAETDAPNPKKATSGATAAPSVKPAPQSIGRQPSPAPGMTARPGAAVPSAAAARAASPELRDARRAQEAANALRDTTGQEGRTALDPAGQDLTRGGGNGARTLGGMPKPSNDAWSTYPSGVPHDVPLPRNQPRSTVVGPPSGNLRDSTTGMASRGGTQPGDVPGHGAMVGEPRKTASDAAFSRETGGSWQETTTLYEDGFTVKDRFTTSRDGTSTWFRTETDVERGTVTLSGEQKAANGVITRDVPRTRPLAREHSQDPDARSGGSPCNPITGVCPEGKQTSGNRVNPGRDGGAAPAQGPRLNVDPRTLATNPSPYGETNRGAPDPRRLRDRPDQVDPPPNDEPGGVPRQ